MSRIYVGQDLESLADLRNYQAWIMEWFRPYLGGRGLEVGAGSGSFSKLLLPHLTHLDLLEPADNVIPRLQETFVGERSVRVLHSTLEEYAYVAEDAMYDVVVMINVLEHMEGDAECLALCRKILKANGALLLFVPAMPFLFSSMDSHLGHHRRYVKSVLQSLLTDAGYEICSLVYFDILGILPWWVVNTLAGQTVFNPTLAKLYDRLAIPVTKWLESRISPPVGKNIIAVAKLK